MNDVRRANPARTFHAGDVDVIGYLSPTIIALSVALAFGRQPMHYAVRGWHRRLEGIRPDPVKA
jgi:hypothetical protein